MHTQEKCVCQTNKYFIKTFAYPQKNKFICWCENIHA